MMILKISGMALVLAATVLAGLYYGSFETYRSNDLQELKKALAILKSEIVFSMTPLPEAFANIGARIRKPVADIFFEFAKRLADNRRAPIEEIWQGCIASHASKTYLNKEDISALISFGRTLGYLDRDMQASGIMITIGYIDTAVAALSTTRAKNQKLFASLGVFAGLVTVIILL